MKILLLGREKFPPFRVDSRVLFGEALARRGYTVDWLMQSGTVSRRTRSEPYGRGTAWIGPYRGGESTFAKMVQSLQATLNSFRTIRLALRNKYDIVLARNVFVRAIGCIVAARLSGSKFVYWLSYPYPEAWIYETKTRVSERPWITIIRGRISDLLLYRVILPTADFVVVQSEQMKEDIAARGIAPEKMCPVPMGVADSMLVGAESLPPKTKEPTVVYVGTLHRVRRLDFLIRVFKRVRKEVPNAILCIVGGEEAAQIEFLQNEAKKLGVDDCVTFTGVVPQAEATGWMARATVSVSPFYPTPILNSTSPTKLVEYMAQGSAVVANDHPEQKQTIEASGAGVCVPYDEEKFAAAIVALLHDPKRVEEMGKRGRLYVKRCRTYSIIAGKVDKQFRKLLGS